MRRICSVVLLAHFYVASLSQSQSPRQTEDAEPPFTLAITANLDSARAFRWDFANSAQTQVRAGSAIALSTRKTNISDHEIDRWSSLGRSTDLRDENGNPVKRREPGNSRPMVSGGSGMLRGTKDTVLQSHESNIHTDWLSDGFVLSQPGTYRSGFGTHFERSTISHHQVQHHHHHRAPEE